ncbi:insulinase family protein [Chitinibacter sp. SCUT-21]|uniref:M16 family metallopeptidase n=1 Tax=Chitinibacter sp. SCUT-21 TaxID=2970891 RepID=UPI0035A66694
MKYLLRLALVASCSFSALSYANTIELPPIIDPAIRHGQLANGLRYFILPNQQHAGKVEVQLLVNVGSMSEAENERGLAHLLEHMAFRRTQNFGQGQVKAFIESEGMRLGHDTNAFTSHESTIYKLSVANTNAEKAVQLIADWAGGKIEIDPSELAAEKNVVLDEARQSSVRSDFYADLMEKMYPASLYPQRLAIGSAKVIDQVKAEQLRAFYQREYQAQRMAVMIVGDIDADHVEAKIKSLFASVKAGTAERFYPVPKSDQGLRLFSHRNLEGLAEPVVRWTWLLPAASIDTAASALRVHQLQVLAQLIQQRLAIQSQKTDSALMQTLGIYSNGNNLLPARQSELSFEAVVKKNKIQDALREVYRELERARRYGFTEQEINTASTVILANAAIGYNNAQWADKIVQHIRYGVPVWGTESTSYVHKRLKDQSKPADYQQLILELLSNKNQLSYMLLPKQLSSFSLLSEHSVKSMVSEVQQEKLAEQSNTSIKPLMAKLPEPGKIVHRENDAATGGQLLTLSNGIQVLTVPNDQPNVGFAALARGGMLALERKLWPAARASNQYLVRAGLGELTYNQINQYLTQNPASIMPLVDVDYFGWLGNGPRIQFETLLQLQYLAFTSRRQDEAESKISGELVMQYSMANGNSIVEELNNRRYGDNWPANQFWRKENTEANLKQLDAVREQWLANPAEFRFVITGVPNDSAYHEPLIERYIASLPTKPTQTVTLPKLAHITPSAITEPRLDNLKGAMRMMQVAVKVPPSTESAVLTEALAELIRMRLMHALREVAGETYGVHAWTIFGESQGALINVLFQNDQAQCTATATIVEKELARIVNEPPSADEVNAIRDRIVKMIKDLPQNPMQHAKMLANHWLLNQKLMAKTPDLAEYNPQMLHSFSQQWLSAGNWTSGVFNCRNEIDFSKLKPATQQASK